MSDLMPDNLFADPIWPALHGPHRHLAIGTGLAGRYPADVAVFAVPHESWGETVAAEIVTNPSETLTLEDVSRYQIGRASCRERVCT